MANSETDGRRWYNLFEKLQEKDYRNRILDEVPEIPGEVRTWLGRLSLLYGVPFDYLVPDEKMLEMESLRFFYFDPLWMECLLDGALSVGRAADVRVVLGKAMAGNFLAEDVIQEAKKIRPQLQGKNRAEEGKARTDDLETTSPKGFWEATALSESGIERVRTRPTPAQSIWQFTGFILRSAIVSGWRGLEINPYAEQGDVSDQTPLPILRLDRLADDTMLCIVEGIMKQLVITQPPESMHFGVEMKSESPISYKKQIRSVSDDGKTKFEVDPVPLREESAPRVIEVKTLVERMEEKLGELDSAKFAVEMVERPVKYTISMKEEGSFRSGS
jgi:hypothetical protein